ncbi:MAG: hypothetical protein GF341_04080 [candidate division Zixibacteria bacterium]|nr:hypothetical protein [candidate division Zixibacteria bacterium]
MRLTSRSIVSALFLVLALGLIGGCGESRPDPKSTVKDLFTAMRDADTTAVRSMVDLRSAATGITEDLPAIQPADSLTVPDTAAWLLGQMTSEGGRLRQRWLSDNQIVLGDTEISGDSALVEVSFLDRVTRVQYYNKMRLVFRSDRWVITHFRTM